MYRQLMAQIVDAIAGGQLGAGQRLPSHRQLGQDLVIAPLTVKKAYDELERAGYIRMRRGSGTFVADTPPQLEEAEVLARLAPLVRQVLVQASVLGVSSTKLRQLFKEQEALLQSSARGPAKEGRSK